MKRLEKGVWYEVVRVAKWGETPAVFLQHEDGKAMPGFFKPPKVYYHHSYQVGDKIKLLQVGQVNLARLHDPPPNARPHGPFRAGKAPLRGRAALLA